MLVRVDVVERQAGRGERGELRRHLGAKLATGGGAREDRNAGARHVAAEAAGRIDQQRHLLRRQRRAALDQHEVEPDAERRHGPRPRDRVGGGVAGDHQAGSGEDAVPVRLLDRVVDRDRGSEVVGGDDEAMHRDQRP